MIAASRTQARRLARSRPNFVASWLHRENQVTIQTATRSRISCQATHDCFLAQDPPGAASYEAVLGAAAGAGAAPGAAEAAALAAGGGVRLGAASAAGALAQLLRASGWPAVYELAEVLDLGLT